MRRLAWWSAVAVAALALAWSMPVGAGDPPAAPKVKVGDDAPDFFLRDLEGNMIRLSDYAFKGPENPRRLKRKVLLDFFRTDCKPCMKELPQVVEFHQNHKDRVQVVLVALLEEEDGRNKLDRWLSANKLPFPVLVDAYENVAKKYIVQGDTVQLPSMFLIDENATVRARLVGLQDNLENELKSALAGGSPDAIPVSR
ncbi:MAG TPA: TlpA disulfide reductase family protein [Myxococcota bacterium]|nr:TlpA disulfide reductase family protein [Myxococcota bacterium]HRY93859.1 TlpA disulfide reductase family protein [Myxococcota bacterium]